MKIKLMIIILLLFSVEVSANNNVFEGNNIEDCDYAMFVKDKINVTLTGNWLCSSGVSDVYVFNSFNVSGSGNSCNITDNYNDTGYVGCESRCVGVAPAAVAGGGGRYYKPEIPAVVGYPVEVVEDYNWLLCIIAVIILLLFLGKLR